MNSGCLWTECLSLMDSGCLDMEDSGCLWTLMSQFDEQSVSVDPYVSV